MTKDEYDFVMGTYDNADPEVFYGLGEDCFEAGWIDYFGFLTPKGERDCLSYIKENDLCPTASP